ncbi:MAG: hypothetical protein OXF02_07055 [Simkaniaceae bacterium]|nr:hypothetical protein [Simkaniaceae bacterium]
MSCFLCHCAGCHREPVIRTGVVETPPQIGPVRIPPAAGVNVCPGPGADTAQALVASVKGLQRERTDPFPGLSRDGEEKTETEKVDRETHRALYEYVELSEDEARRNSAPQMV